MLQLNPQLHVNGIQLLVVDDGADVHDIFRRALEPRGISVFSCLSGREAQEFLNSRSVDLVISDVNMPGMKGDELLSWVIGNHPTIPVIMLTGFATIEHAVRMMKIGAFDYICKPITDFGETVRSISRAAEYRKLLVENQLLRRELDHRHRFDQIIGPGAAMQRVFRVLETVAPTPAPVLITGPSGTGKELIAGAIHFNSPRAHKPFIRVNCVAVPESLFESELFGYEKGAFTGALKTYRGKIEAAQGGTLLLDEIGDMPLSMQAKLLRVLQENEISRLGSNEVIKVDFRLVATTNTDLEKAVEDKKFRMDLFFRLNVVPIELPPLAARTDDIPALAYHFLKYYAKSYKRPSERFSPAALRYLCEAPWPGNVRQLQNAVARAVVFNSDEVIELADFFTNDQPEELPAEATSPRVAADEDGDEVQLAEVEKRHILRMLERYDGHRARTADALGISVRTLRNKLNDYRIKDLP